MDDLSIRIHQARKDAGLTQEQLAREIRVTLRTITRWETGVTQNISTRSLMEIARVTGQPLTFFFEAAS